jgi:hypothetical protein
MNFIGILSDSHDLITHSLILLRQIFTKVAYLIVLKIGLWLMTCAVNVFSLWLQSTPPRRIALTRVHYYSHLPSLQQSKPAFVSYIGSDELTTEFQQGKIWASNKDLKISIQSSHLKNKLYYKGELEDLEVGDDVILLSGSATDLEIGIAQTFTAYYESFKFF